ncbi:MAG TPA: glycosyltransferase family 2 protein [Candidatus Hydrogenedentes bacterium]|nr:glycosyltransferase family 2 protein [Candidatus Hydrogenedentota bacterium]HOS02347.1 glycosyltransferase family 2 protein [Candidatus Hydrogenedentota bacterium]
MRGSRWCDAPIAACAGGGVIEAFYSGYDRINPKDYDYICKLDADITFGDDYFENILKKMEADPRLAAASGKVFNPSLGSDKLFEESIIDEQVSGAAKFYRRTAFESIGGFVQENMWDGIDFHRARMMGWKTRSFRDENLRILHYRLMGSSHKSVYHGRLRWGLGQWFMGTHPLYIFATGVYRMHERPFVIGGLLIIAGYFWGMLQGRPRYDDRRFRRHLHHWQLRRLRLGFLAPKLD